MSQPQRRISAVSTGLLAVAAVVLAVVSWAGNDDGSLGPSTSLIEDHQLTADQAACLSFGVIVRTAASEDLLLTLGKYSALDPDAAIALRHEMSALDLLPSTFPGADYRLIGAFSALANSGARILSADQFAYRDATATRSARQAEAAAHCVEIAGFDPETLAVVGSQK